MKLIAFMLIILFACGSGNAGDSSEHAPYLAPAPTGIKTKEIPLPDSSCLNGSVLSYENFGRGVISDYCLACHSRNLDSELRYGAPTELNFDEAMDVRTWRVRILDVFDGKIKHKIELGRSPDSIDKKMALEWLECGAP